MCTRLAALVTLTACLATVPATSQVTGLPIIANPKTHPGITATGVLTLSSGQAGGGWGWTAEVDWTVGRVSFRALLGSRHPNEEFSLPVDLTSEIEGYAVYGVGGALRLLGGSGEGFAISMHAGAGFESSHRAVFASESALVGVPSRKTYTITLAVGLREHFWGVGWEPWVAGGVRSVKFDLGEIPRCVNCPYRIDPTPERYMPHARTRPGVSGGLDLWVTPTFGMRVAFDLTQVDVPVLHVYRRPFRETVLFSPSHRVRTRPQLLTAGFRVRFPKS
jgi:hypothetical protein